MTNEPHLLSLLDPISPSISRQRQLSRGSVKPHPFDAGDSKRDGGGVMLAKGRAWCMPHSVITVARLQGSAGL